MRFKICSVGWNCEDFITRTLLSVECQTLSNWDISICYDKSDDNGADVIRTWCEQDPEHRQYRINDEQLYAVRNQVEGIRAMNPDPEDVIVWLDLDGDQLASPRTLQLLDDYYEAGALLTYGTHYPVSGDLAGYTKPIPYPDDVVKSGTYREYTLNYYCCFNHLRTMKYEIFSQIPDEYFHYLNEPDRWYDAGADYAIMMAGLELANGRYTCIPETTLLYNDLQPHPDNKTHPQRSDEINYETLRRPNVRDYLGLPR